jgi:cytochrome c oxidase cbb3-type subunit 4
MVNFDIALTIILFIVFIGIIVWAWSPGRKRDFSDAAHLVVDDDIDNVKSNKVPEGHKHG